MVKELIIMTSEVMCVLQNSSMSLVQLHEVGVVLANVKEYVSKHLSLGLCD